MHERPDIGSGELEGGIDGESRDAAPDSRGSSSSASDVPRLRQQQPAEGVPAGATAAGGERPSKSAEPPVQAAGSGAEVGDRADEEAAELIPLEDAREDDEEVAVGELEEPGASQQDLVRLLAAVVSQSSSWSGLLPPPDDFAKYPEHVQARMMAWNDFTTVDESRRQDRLVEAEIEQARTGRWIAVGFTAFCFVTALVFFALGNEVAGFAFLAAPVLTAGGKFLSGVFSRSSREPAPPPAEASAEPPAPPELGPGDSGQR